jgi:hypothetical protein
LYGTALQSATDALGKSSGGKDHPGSALNTSGLFSSGGKSPNGGMGSLFGGLGMSGVTPTGLSFGGLISPGAQQADLGASLEFPAASGGGGGGGGGGGLAAGILNNSLNAKHAVLKSSASAGGGTVGNGNGNGNGNGKKGDLRIDIPENTSKTIEVAAARGVGVGDASGASPSPGPLTSLLMRGPGGMNLSGRGDGGGNEKATEAAAAAAAVRADAAKREEEKETTKLADGGGSFALPGLGGGDVDVPSPTALGGRDRAAGVKRARNASVSEPSPGTGKRSTRSRK